MSIFCGQITKNANLLKIYSYNSFLFIKLGFIQITFYAQNISLSLNEVLLLT